MKRWQLVTSDDWIEANIECIIRSRQSVRIMREEMIDCVKKLRNELLHGDQGVGCSNPNCKVCYPFGKRKKAVH